MSIKSFLSHQGQLIKPTELESLLSAKQRLAAVDASWYMPNNPRNGFKEFLTQGRLIRNARYLDVDEVKDPDSPYSHMLPSVEVFNQHAKRLGLPKDDPIIVYDNAGNFSAPRVAWMLEIFGNKNTLLLDNYVEYKAQGFPIDTAEIKEPVVEANVASFVSSALDKSRVILFEELKTIVEDPAQAARDYVIFDARPNGRFTGRDPEPRPGLSSGHVPTAISVPFPTVLDAASNNQFLSAAALREVFDKALGGKPLGDRQVIVMCGSGVTACVIERAVRIAGLTDKPVRVYDGSWT